ncbi:MAG TPA: HNH endonuclease, partial [candidate division Zixibacteria bacterium]|nr:HNH endonuclease [candidate division Zixibacteria bacterium]
NRRVLLLNQNYEPLSVCSAKRAIVLVIEGKAEMIESADGLKLRTVRTSYSLPSVVRLWNFRKVPLKRIMLTRKNIILRDDGRCQYCGANKGPMTVDHVIPRTEGGSDSWSNLVCACERCNNLKGNRTPEQAGMGLLRRPTRPSYITFIQRNYGVADQWRPYLFLDYNNGTTYTT